MEKWIRNYREEETEVVNSLATDALKKYGDSLTAEKLVLHLYQDKLPRKDSFHAYRETGSLLNPTFLHSLTVTELFPIRDKKQCERLLGVSIDDLKWLIDAGLVVVSIHDPQQYQDIEYLHPILKNNDRRPPSFEIRDKVIYRILSNGMYDAYIEEAAHHPVLSQPIWPVDLQEPYERVAGLKQDRVIRKNIQRYAVLGSILGPDVVRSLVDVDPNNERECRRVMKRFFTLHKLVIHPITQGLYGLPHNHLHEYLPKEQETLNEYASQVETVLMDHLEIPIPKRLNHQQVLEAHELGLASAFEKMQNSLIQGIVKGEVASDGHGTIRNNLEEILGQIDEKVNATIGRTVEHMKMALSLATFLGQNIINGQTLSSRSSAKRPSAAIRQLLPDLLAEPITRAVYKVFGDNPLLLHYWDLRKAAGHWGAYLSRNRPGKKK
ncbi:MAG TPA: hypothetical protein VJ875_03045 [Pyrinomonadaceae bacterium]|nr:hypothetical protein [Pyrinomonadaceae bacterium]